MRGLPPEEQSEILQIYFSNMEGNTYPSFTFVASTFNRNHPGRPTQIRGHDVEKIVNRLLQYGVCYGSHQQPRVQPEGVSPELKELVNEYYSIPENRNNSIRTAARELGNHHTTVYR